MALISPDSTIEDAIRVLDKGAMRIAIVVDSNKNLLGTVTDGDVRRGLLRHLTLNGNVTEVMNANPKAAQRNWTKDRILLELEQYQIAQLPVLGDDGTVVGVQTLQELLHSKYRDNAVFLMAGGFGTRLRPLTENCPKPMLKIGNKPILELILENFISAGFHRFYISTHYLPEMIQNHFGDGSRWGVSIEYVHEEEPLGTGGALGLLPHDKINEPLFVMNGDLLTVLNFESLLQFHKEHPGVATMCVRQYQHQVPYGVVQSEGHRIKNMVEKPTHHYFINAGIYLLSPELVKTVVPGERIDMPSLLERHLDSSNGVNMFPVHEYWLDIGRMEDFNKAQTEFTKG